MERNIETLHHIPQQNRRNKLRFICADHSVPPPITQQANAISSHHHHHHLVSPINFTHFSSSHSVNPNHHQPVLGRPNNSHVVQYCNDPDKFCLFQEGPSLSLSMQQEHGTGSSVDCPSKQIIRSSNPCPLGPFTGYALVLKQSRFLKPAQQILDDFFGILDVGISLVSSFESFEEDPMVQKDRVGQRRWKAFTLLSILDEVNRRYKLCHQQIELVVSSFEGVCGLGNASPYTALAFKSITKHFVSLKDTILCHLNLTSYVNASRKNLVKRYDPQLDLSSLQMGHNRDHTRMILQIPFCRSQRGLPDHAVALLRTWLFENFLHPYPTDSEKQMLALQTGLSRTQVSNWFINARVRLWKPMVTEIHELKECRSQLALNLTGNNKRSRSDRNGLSHDSRGKRSKMAALALDCHHEIDISAAVAWRPSLLPL